MADENRKQAEQQQQSRNRPQDPGKLNENSQDNESLIDQMDEDRNVSGSNTYRTLPDQEPERDQREPDGEQERRGRDDRDAQARQSNR